MKVVNKSVFFKIKIDFNLLVFTNGISPLYSIIVIFQIVIKVGRVKLVRNSEEKKLKLNKNNVAGVTKILCLKFNQFGRAAPEAETISLRLTRAIFINLA